MKIYINNFNLDVLNDIAELYKEHLIGSDKYIKLFTDDGMYRIENKKIYNLEQIDKDIKKYENYYNKFTLIVDPSYFLKQYVTSILGETHISLHVTKNYYKLNKNSHLQLVITYLVDNKKQIPNDIYFEINKEIDINDVPTKNEIIEFLSVLN
jgi:hypothetical protein